MTPQDYVIDEMRYYSSYISKIISEQFEKGIRTGTVRPSDPIGSCYWDDQSSPVIAASTIANFADYSTLPDTHDLTDWLGDADFEERSPREAQHIRLYTSARGALFHRRLKDASTDAMSAFISEIGHPPVGDTWRDVRETISNSIVTNELSSPPTNPMPDFVPSGLDAIAEAAREDVFIADTIWTDFWDDIEHRTYGREVPFISREDGPANGGKMDSVVRVVSNGPIERAVYVVDAKFASRLRPQDFVRMEAYRRAMTDRVGIERALDGMLLRVDPLEGEVEVVTTRDDDWPEGCWEIYKRSDERFRQKHPMIDVRMKQVLGSMG